MKTIFKALFREKSEYIMAIEEQRSEIEQLEAELKRDADFSSSLIRERDEKVHRLSIALEGAKDVCDEMQEELKAAREAMKLMALKQLELGCTLEEVYNLISPVLDDGGWAMYRECEKLIAVNIYSHYYAEDCMGKFEEMDGFGLAYHAEVAKFGHCEHTYQGSYEFVSSMHLDKESEDYIAYKEELYAATMAKILGEFAAKKRFVSVSDANQIIALECRVAEQEKYIDAFGLEIEYSEDIEYKRQQMYPRMEKEQLHLRELRAQLEEARTSAFRRATTSTRVLS